MIHALTILDDYLARLENLLLTLVSGVMILILMSQVILRYLFSHPLFWAEEVSVQLLVFMTLIGLSLLLKDQRMITIDLVTSFFPKRIQSVLSTVLGVTSLAILIFFAFIATQWICRPEVRLEFSPTTDLPVWYNYTALPLALYAMVFHQLIRLIIHFRSSAET